MISYITNTIYENSVLRQQMDEIGLRNECDENCDYFETNDFEFDSILGPLFRSQLQK